MVHQIIFSYTDSSWSLLFDSLFHPKMTVMNLCTCWKFGALFPKMQSSSFVHFNSHTFLHFDTPAELLLISHGQFLCVRVCLSRHSGCFHSAHFWRGDLHPLRPSSWGDTYAHKSHTNTHSADRGAEGMLGKKTGWWSNWFNRGLVMFV